MSNNAHKSNNTHMSHNARTSIIHSATPWMPRNPMDAWVTLGDLQGRGYCELATSKITIRAGGRGLYRDRYCHKYKVCSAA
jgi:hypothetical protein